MLKVAVMTSGGDCQGMNTCLFNLVKCAKVNDIELIGFYGGFRGLIENDYIVLDFDFVKNVNNMGGSCLKTARSKEFMTKNGRQKAVKNLKDLGIEVLICIGGDGTFHGALELIKLGIKCICIPATIDNDLNYTNKTLGFDTAVNNATNAISDIMETMRANNRCCVVEVMGRHCGDIALSCAVASHADMVLVPEVPIKIYDAINQAKSIVQNGNLHPTIVVAENQFDLEAFSKLLEDNIDREVKYCVLGYIQRGGKPTVDDRLLGMQFAVCAIKCVLDGIYNVAIGINNKKIITTNIQEAIDAKSDFDYELYNLFNLLND